MSTGKHRFRPFRIARLLGFPWFVLIFCQGLFFADVALLSFHTAVPIAWAGVETEGTVKQVIELPSTRGPKTARVIIEYEAGTPGKTYQKSQIIYGRPLNGLSEGAAIPIAFLPDQPTRALSFHKSRLRYGYFAAIVALACAFYIWWRGLKSFRLFLSARRAATRGKTRSAIVRGAYQNSKRAFRKTQPPRLFRRGPLHVLEWTDSEGIQGRSISTDLSNVAYVYPGSRIEVRIDPDTGTAWWSAQILA